MTAVMVGNRWRTDIAQGTHLRAGEPVAVLEATKLELPVPSPETGTVLRVLTEPETKVEPVPPSP